MRIEKTNIKNIGILGLARSGTTLLSNIFNSIDDSICLSEPIRGLNRLNLKPLTNTKIDNVEDLLNFGNNYNSKLFSYKETYSLFRGEIGRNIKYMADNVDALVFIVREPKSCYSAWRQLKVKVTKNGLVKRPRYSFTSDNFIDMYKSILKLYETESKNKPCFLIKYEDLYENRNNLTEFFNSKFNSEIKLSGELNEIKDSIITLGDHSAKGVSYIKKPRLTYPNLEDNDVKNIETNLSDIYNQL